MPSAAYDGPFKGPQQQTGRVMETVRKFSLSESSPTSKNTTLIDGSSSAIDARQEDPHDVDDPVNRRRRQQWMRDGEDTRDEAFNADAAATAASKAKKINNVVVVVDSTGRSGGSSSGINTPTHNIVAQKRTELMKSFQRQQDTTPSTNTTTATSSDGHSMMTRCNVDQPKQKYQYQHLRSGSSSNNRSVNNTGTGTGTITASAATAATVIETNKVLTNHLKQLQSDCNKMSNILDNVEQRLQTIERKNQPLLDLADSEPKNRKNNQDITRASSTTRTSANALLCRLEAVDAYISSLQDVIDVQHTEIQQLLNGTNIKDNAPTASFSSSSSSSGGGGGGCGSVMYSPQQQLLFEKLQGRFVRKACNQLDLLAKLQDDIECKDVQIKQLESQLLELQGGGGNQDDGHRRNHRNTFFPSVLKGKADDGTK
jgi:uncharacterized spore protein YtfJ